MADRDSRGRFLPEGAHEYRLRYFESGTEDTVRAYSPAAAVAARKQRPLPDALTDMTLLRHWRLGIHPQRSGIHTLLGRLRGAGWADE